MLVKQSLVQMFSETSMISEVFKTKQFVSVSKQAFSISRSMSLSKDISLWD